jgi:hypothetical protein
LLITSLKGFATFGLRKSAEGLLGYASDLLASVPVKARFSLYNVKEVSREVQTQHPPSSRSAKSASTKAFLLHGAQEGGNSSPPGGIRGDQDHAQPRASSTLLKRHHPQRSRSAIVLSAASRASQDHAQAFT